MSLVTFIIIITIPEQTHLSVRITRYSGKEAVLRECNVVEMGPANSLHASTYYSEYNERFDSDK